jgi:nicotinate-nucleotide--dimethylbenzimidazole phosphoribosyltransferase
MITVTVSSLQQELQHRIDQKTKPPGALGRLEEIALQVGCIQKTTQPAIRRPHIVVFAGDHGISETGLVNAWPQAVTAQMVLNFLRGGAAINVFCRQHHIHLAVVDAGVKYDFNNIQPPTEQGVGFIQAKIGWGTRNYLHGPAMEEQELLAAIQKGKDIVQDIAHNSGCNCIGFGEMGIGNTSSASLIMSAITGLPVADCTGKGAGASAQQLQQKIQTLQKVYDKHQLGALSQSPYALLSAVGGYEIAMMTGAYLQAAALDMVIVADGFITGAALMLATLINPGIKTNCVFAHCSNEQGHAAMLRYMGARPLLQLDMRLGEGTGAALAIPLLQSAVNFLNEMASLEELGKA